MKKSAHFDFLMIFSILPFLAVHAESNAWKVSFDGYGPVKVGMDIKEAEKLIGVSIERQDGAQCSAWVPNLKGNFNEISFKASNGRIIGIQVNASDVLTERGAKVGDSEDEILKLFGKKVFKTFGNDLLQDTLTVHAIDKKQGIIFYMVNGKVRSYFAGVLDDAGCD